MARRSLSVVADRPVVAMCAGKDCRKRCEFAKMRDSLDAQCDVVELKCIGLCNGPVVVIDPERPKPAVYSRLRSKRQRSLLLSVVAGDKRAIKELAGRRVSKKKAVSSVARQVRRRLPSQRAA